MYDYSVALTNTDGVAFPNTTAVNATTPTSLDGTEFVKLFIDDMWGANQALMYEMGFTPDGNQETYLASQRLDALKGLSARYGSAYGCIGRADSVADINKDVIISVGQVPDSTRVYTLRRTAEISKSLDVAWAAGGVPGTPVGGLPSGESLTANTEYGVYEIYNPTTKTRDACFSTYTGAGVPNNLPSGYTIWQLVDWVLTDGSSNIIQTDTKDIGNGNIEKYWITPTIDINLTSTLTTTRRLDTLPVPTGFEIEAYVTITLADAAQRAVFIGSPSFADVAPASVASITDYPQATVTEYTSRYIKTNTSAQVAARADGTVTTYQMSVKSFILLRL